MWGAAEDLQPWFFLRLESIRSNFNRFEFARDFAQEVGFKLILSGLSCQQVLQADLTQLDIELVRADLPVVNQEDEAPDYGKLLAKTFEIVSRESLIVRGCDSINSLRQSIEAGAFYVQGKAADRVYAGNESLAA